MLGELERHKSRIRAMTKSECGSGLGKLASEGRGVSVPDHPIPRFDEAAISAQLGELERTPMLGENDRSWIESNYRRCMDRLLELGGPHSDESEKKLLLKLLLRLRSNLKSL